MSAIASPLLNSTLGKDEWSDSQSCCFRPREPASCTHCLGSCGPQRQSGRYGNERISFLCRKLNPDSSTLQPVACLLYSLRCKVKIFYPFRNRIPMHIRAFFLNEYTQNLYDFHNVYFSNANCAKTYVIRIEICICSVIKVKLSL